MSFLDRLFGRSREPERDPEPDKTAQVPADDADLHEPDADEAPRGGIRTEEYRKADPRDVVEAGGTLMAGPGGTPQDDGPADHPAAAGLDEPEKQEEPGQQ